MSITELVIPDYIAMLQIESDSKTELIMEIADRIAIDLVNADTDHNEVAKASAYFNQVRNANDFFEWLAWMATPRVSDQLARSRRTPDYYKQINRACQQLKSITDEQGKPAIGVMAQTLAWAVRLMRYHPYAKPVAPDLAVAQQLTSPVMAQPLSAKAVTHQATALHPVQHSTQPAITSQLRIRDLQPGMEMKGIVKRLAKFGAFVDIGVGRDGLVHISRLHDGYVAQVEDVVHAGDAVTVWVTEVDAGQGKIGLTMVRPPQPTRPVPQPTGAPPPMPKTESEPPVRPAAVRVTSVEAVKPGLWVLGTVTKVETNRLVVEIGLAEGASLTFERLPGKLTDPDDVAEQWPAGTELEAQVVSINKRGRIQLTLATAN